MKLTPEARAEMLVEYQRGARPADLSARYGVSLALVHYYRRNAGITTHRARGGGVPVLVEMSPLLPVYDVRLVSRPGEKP